MPWPSSGASSSLLDGTFSDESVSDHSIISSYLMTKITTVGSFQYVFWDYFWNFLGILLSSHKVHLFIRVTRAFEIWILICYHESQFWFLIFQNWNFKHHWQAQRNKESSREYAFSHNYVDLEIFVQIIPPNKKWRISNECISLVHSIVSGLWAGYVLISDKQFSEDPIHYRSPMADNLVRVSF